METWEPYESDREVTSAFQTHSFSFKEWLNNIKQSFGWDIDDIKQDEDGYYVATATDPETGDTTETRDKDANRALSFLYSRINRAMASRIQQLFVPQTVMAKFAAWDKYFVDRIEEIAQEYAEAKYYDKKAATAWTELAHDNKRRAEMIKSQIDVEVTDHPLPYKSFNDMVEDVINKKKFVVSSANADHPVWSTDEVVDFRIVHDILGHVAAGADWSWFGMNKAFAAHAPLLSVEAQKALFTEVLGRGAFNAYYRSMAQDKVAFLKCFDEPQKSENRPAHRETHPSQSPVPVEIPKVASADLRDPNEDWESGVVPDEYNAFIHHRILTDAGDVIDPLNSSALKEIIHEIDPRWDQHSDDAYLKQAIINAFRVALLKSHLTDEDHARHYQAIHHIPPHITDPLSYWDAIHADRNAHNLARGYSEAGKELDVFIPALMSLIQNINPHLIGEDLHNEARRTIFDMRCEEEGEVKDKLGPEALSDAIANEALNRMIKRLTAITKVAVKDDQDFKSANRDPRLYPSPLASNIKPLSGVAEHLEDLSNAAKEDLHRGGKGHHFRASTLKKNLEGLGPDKISEAWFYLSPYTSQLGVLSPSIVKSLGHKPGELHPRDYFKAERQLQSGRDAAGYNHMPLGQFSHGLNNTMHHPQGYHPSQKHLHTIHPTKHYHMDWSQKPQAAPKPKSPGWWNNTKPQRTQTGKDWDRAEAIKHPKGNIPYKTADAAFTPMLSIPFFNHPDTSAKTTGQPGQTNMHHVLESLMLQDQGPQAVWNQDLELGKEVPASANN